MSYKKLRKKFKQEKKKKAIKEVDVEMDLARLFGQGTRGNVPQAGLDVPTMDTAEIVHISSLALLKVSSLFF